SARCGAATRDAPFTLNPARQRRSLSFTLVVSPSIMRAQLSINLFTITVLAVVAGYYAIFTMSIVGIHSSNWTDADTIRHCCPIRLIQPEWVSSQPDTLMNWCVAEIKARLGLIAALWLGSVSTMSWRYLKKRKNTHAG